VNDEAEQVRSAVLDSIRIGTLSDELIALVYSITRDRTSDKCHEDIAQNVLVGLLARLARIRPDRYDTHAYVCKCIVNSWRKMCRKRRAERKYLCWAANLLLEEIPANQRITAKMQSIGSEQSFRRMKYY
jgi:DNA-directed RNA polymerase specialized sigma24 family protein